MTDFPTASQAKQQTAELHAELGFRPIPAVRLSCDEVLDWSALSVFWVSKIYGSWNQIYQQARGGYGSTDSFEGLGIVRDGTLNEHFEGT